VTPRGARPARGRRNVVRIVGAPTNGRSTHDAWIATKT
jgi:hypothetical protein